MTPAPEATAEADSVPLMPMTITVVMVCPEGSVWVERELKDLSPAVFTSRTSVTLVIRWPWSSMVKFEHFVPFSSEVSTPLFRSSGAVTAVRVSTVMAFSLADCERPAA